MIETKSKRGNRIADPTCPHMSLQLRLTVFGRRVFWCHDCQAFTFGRTVGRATESGAVRKYHEQTPIRENLRTYLSNFPSQNIAAEKIGVNSSTLSRWKFGKEPIPDWMRTELDRTI